MQRRSNQRFARACRRIKNHVLLLEQFQDGGFLSWIKLEPAALDIVKEASEQRVVVGGIPWNQIVKCRGHSPVTIASVGVVEKRDAVPRGRSALPDPLDRTSHQVPVVGV